MNLGGFTTDDITINCPCHIYLISSYNYEFKHERFQRFRVVVSLACNIPLATHLNYALISWWQLDNKLELE